MSTNYTETNSANSVVMNTYGIEKVDKEKITNAGNMTLEGVLSFIWNAHFYRLNGERIRHRINIDVTEGKITWSKKYVN